MLIPLASRPRPLAHDLDGAGSVGWWAAGPGRPGLRGRRPLGVRSAVITLVQVSGGHRPPPRSTEQLGRTQRLRPWTARPEHQRCSAERPVYQRLASGGSEARAPCSPTCAATARPTRSCPLRGRRRTSRGSGVAGSCRGVGHGQTGCLLGGMLGPAGGLTASGAKPERRATGRP
jgi:hypothetical protein